MGSAVLIHVRDISKMLILESVVFLCQFSSIMNFSPVLSLPKQKQIPLAYFPTPSQVNSLGSAVLILVCDISNKLGLESVAFWFLVSSNQSSHETALKKHKTSLGLGSCQHGE